MKHEGMGADGVNCNQIANTIVDSAESCKEGDFADARICNKSTWARDNLPANWHLEVETALICVD